MYKTTYEDIVCQSNLNKFLAINKRLSLISDKADRVQYSLLDFKFIFKNLNSKGKYNVTTKDFSRKWVAFLLTNPAYKPIIEDNIKDLKNQAKILAIKVKVESIKNKKNNIDNTEEIEKMNQQIKTLNIKYKRLSSLLNSKNLNGSVAKSVLKNKENNKNKSLNK